MKSVCDDCKKDCAFRAPTGGLDPPVTDCPDLEPKKKQRAILRLYNPNKLYIPYVRCKSLHCKENDRGVCTIPYVDLRVDYFGKCVFYNPKTNFGG